MKKNQVINGKKDGYWEDYHNNGQLWKKGNYIKSTFPKKVNEFKNRFIQRAFR